MDADNLIFSSSIDVEVEEGCFNILFDYLSDADYKKVYVKNIVCAPNELLFFANVEEKETIIRVPVIFD